MTPRDYFTLSALTGGAILIGQSICLVLQHLNLS